MIMVWSDDAVAADAGVVESHSWYVDGDSRPDGLLKHSVSTCLASWLAQFCRGKMHIDHFEIVVFERQPDAVE